MIPDHFENNRLLRNGSYFSIHLRECGLFELETEVYPPRKDDQIPNPQKLINLRTLPRMVCDHKESGKCMHCHRKEASMACSPCGHRVICPDCARERIEHQSDGYESHCPLCDSLTHVYTQVSEEEEFCLICRECPATTMIQPCGHKCVCYECAMKISQEHKKCPHCNERLSGIKQEFAIYGPVIQQEISLPKVQEPLDEESQDDNVLMITPILRWSSTRSLYNPLKCKGKFENGRCLMGHRGFGIRSKE